MSKFENKYDECNHIWVTTYIFYDGREGKALQFLGCVKCGLDQNVFDLVEYNVELTSEEQIMYDYLKARPFVNGTMIKKLCDFELAKAIYAKVKENHPDIDDKKAIQYFNAALANIRSNEVSEERKNSRAQRLCLKPGFNNWNGSDVFRHN